MERLNFETLFRVVRWDYNRCLKDEPDRNLDIDNIMQIYNVLSFHKPQTQIIAIVHNPALIYKLSKLDCVNFIETTEGYLKDITNFINETNK